MVGKLIDVFDGRSTVCVQQDGATHCYLLVEGALK